MARFPIFSKDPTILKTLTLLTWAGKNRALREIQKYREDVTLFKLKQESYGLDDYDDMMIYK